MRGLFASTVTPYDQQRKKELDKPRVLESAGGFWVSNRQNSRVRECTDGA